MPSFQAAQAAAALDAARDALQAEEASHASTRERLASAEAGLAEAAAHGALEAEQRGALHAQLEAQRVAARQARSARSPPLPSDLALA